MGLALGFVAVGCGGGGDGDDGVAAVSIDGVETFVIGEADHVETPVAYDQSPPVGGDHSPAWLNCGYYNAVVPNENAVHALEHGAVWITYKADEIDEATLEALQARIAGETHILVSPYIDQTSPVVLSAWGAQLEVDDFSDARVESFIDRYESSDQSPEPGAPCNSGVGEPTIQP